MTRSEILELQKKLTELGYDPGPIDGWYGEKTAIAYRNYQHDQKQEVPVLIPAPQKPWYLSRALLGALATIIASLVGLLGYSLDANQLTDVLTSTATLGFGILAFVGTIQRKGSIRRGKGVIENGGTVSDAERMRVVMPAEHRAENERYDDPPPTGWNG